MKDEINVSDNNISTSENWKKNNLSLTKISSGSNEFKELNREIFQKIQQGENISGINNTDLSINSNNNSNYSLPSFNDIDWKKKCPNENSSYLDSKNINSSNMSNISVKSKKNIEILNIKNTYDEKDSNTSNKDNNIMGNNFIPKNSVNINNDNEKKISLIPEDTMEEDLDNNQFIFNNIKQVNNNNDNLQYNGLSNNNNNYNQMPMNNQSNNLMVNYINNNLISINNNININNSKNFVKKSNYPMIINNSQNTNIIINNIRNPIPQNSNPNFFYYPNQMNQNLGNFSYNNNNFNNYPMQPFMYPENAFSYNQPNNINNYMNTNNKYNMSNQYQNNNNQNKQKNTDKKKKKKFKDKLEQKLFIIDLDNLINGTEERTTIMIRHIPNKYTTQALLDELNVYCKNKYDFFYLPIDDENECNLGYAFINFIHPLHVVHFYHIFIHRKWNMYKSNKECDLTFAKFQGRAELTANLEKNMDQIEDKKNLPLVLDVLNPAKIELEKKYFEEIKKNRSELLKDINWI